MKRDLSLAAALLFAGAVLLGGTACSAPKSDSGSATSSAAPGADSAGGGAPGGAGGGAGYAGGQGGGRNQRFGQLLLSLGLTDQQKAQIKQIMADARKQNENITDRDQRRANMRAAFAKVQTVLTPEQQTKLKAKIAAYRAQHGQSPQGQATPQ